MLDLGTSFLGSVARDPNALAIVDGGVRARMKADGAAREAGRPKCPGRVGR